MRRGVEGKDTAHKGGGGFLFGTPEKKKEGRKYLDLNSKRGGRGA